MTPINDKTFMCFVQGVNNKASGLKKIPISYTFSGYSML